MLRFSESPPPKQKAKKKKKTQNTKKNQQKTHLDSSGILRYLKFLL